MTLKINLRAETFRIHADHQVVVELSTTGTVFFSRHLFVGTQIELFAIWMLENDYIVGWCVEWALGEQYSKYINRLLVIIKLTFG